MSPARPPHLASGSTLQFLRGQAGLTQEELSDKSDLHTTAISRLENGWSTPKWESMKALAKAFGITRWELVALAEWFEWEQAEAVRERVETALSGS